MSIREKLFLSRRPLGVKFIDDEEKERYEILNDFYEVFIIPEIDEKVHKMFKDDEDEYSSDIEYSYFEDEIGQKWCEMMKNYLPDLWKRIDEKDAEEYRALIDDLFINSDPINDDHNELPF